MRAIELFAYRIDSNDANAIEYFARWQTRPSGNEEIVRRRRIEGEHHDVMSTFNETFRYPLQQSFGAADQRCVTWRNVNDAEGTGPMRLASSVHVRAVR